MTTLSRLQVRKKGADKLVRAARAAFDACPARNEGVVPEARAAASGNEKSATRFKGSGAVEADGAGGWSLGVASQCRGFTLSEEVYCFVAGVDCCQAISQSRGALKVVRTPY